MTPQDGWTLVWLRDQTATGRAREARESARLTRSELATILGIPVPTLQSWESGRRRPTGTAALRYAATLAELTALAVPSTRSSA